MARKYIFFLLLLVYTVWFLDILSIVGLFNNVSITNKNHFKNIFLSYTAIYFLLVFFSSFLSENKFKILLSAISVPMTAINFILVWYCLYYKSFISVDDITTLLASNIQESREFIITVFDYKIFISLLISVIPYPLIYFMKPIRFNKKYLPILMLLVSIIIIALTGNKRWVKREIAVANICDTYIQVKKDRRIFEEILADYDEKEIKFDNIISILTRGEGGGEEDFCFSNKRISEQTSFFNLWL